MQLYEPPANREPETRPLVLLHERALALHERLEEPPLQLRLDPGAAVPHEEADVASLLERADVDRRPSGRELDRVCQQVQQDLPDPPRVSADE